MTAAHGWIAVAGPSDPGELDSREYLAAMSLLTDVESKR